MWIKLFISYYSASLGRHPNVDNPLATLYKNKQAKVIKPSPN